MVLLLTSIATRAENHLKLPDLSPGVRTLCVAVKNATEYEVGAEMSLDDIESMFLSSLSLDVLLSAALCTPVWLWVQDLVSRRFSSTIQVSDAATMPGRKSCRVGVALVMRMSALELLEVPNAGEEFVRQHEAVVKKEAARLENNLATDDVGSASVSSVPGSRLQTIGGNAGTSGDVLRREHDPTKFRRAVQSHFQDGAEGERAKFTGDLAKAPSFDLWDRRYRTLMKSLNVSESDKVLFLSEALADPALTFFYNNICPDDSRSGNSLVEAAAVSPMNLAPNISTLSGALAALEKHFCTDAARNVLKQELDQLKLSHVERDEKVSKPVALAKLKDRIRRLSCNGPKDFRTEPCMIAALRKSLSGEEWAIDPLVNASDRAAKYPSDKTLEHYVQTLISYLREKETLTGSGNYGNGSTAVVPGAMSHGLAGVYYGDARANPRQTRTTYRAPLRSRPQFPRQVQRNLGSTNSRAPSGLPSGMELRQMLARPQLGANGRASGSRTAQRVCWNCDEPGHLLRDCPKPRRPSVDFARAMLVDNVPPLEVAVWMAREAEQLEEESRDSSRDCQDGADEEAEVEEEVAYVDEDDDPTHVFDTLLATMSRDSHPRQDFC